MGPPAEEEERAAIRSCSSSMQAVSKYSKLMRICTICPRYCELNFSTRDLQTFSERSWSKDCSKGYQYKHQITDRKPFSYLFECLINHIGMLEVIIGEEVELVQEIPYINATEGVHL